MVAKLLRDTTTGGHRVDTSPLLGDLQVGIPGSRHAPSSNAPDLQRLGRFHHLRILRIILASRCKCLRLILYAMQWKGYEALHPLELLNILFRSSQEVKFRRNYSILQMPLIAIGGSSLRCIQMQADGAFANRSPPWPPRDLRMF